MTVKKYSEDELVILLKLNDKLAFNYLYDKYSSSLYGIIFRILNQDEDMANDVLQEVFIKIWKKIASYDSQKGTLFTWMLNITRNSSIDALRVKSRVTTQPITNEISILTNFQNNGKLEDSIGVKEILDKLRVDYKVVLDLAYFKGYTQEEISQLLNIPIGTVKSRTRAALAELRNLLTVSES